MQNKYVDRSIEKVALVTGATGLLGKWLVPELLGRGYTVIAPVRRADARRAEVEAMFVAKGADTTRLRVVQGDLDEPALGLSPDVKAQLHEVTAVFHLGAQFAWGLTEQAAHRTNVLGTSRIVELAASLPRAPRLVLIGGYRLVPRMDARGAVRTLTARDFTHAGAYEASKFHAHEASLALARARGVPFTVVHPCSVIGDSRTGETPQVTGLGESMVALSRGELPVRAFGARTFVPLIPVDFVATFLASVAEHEGARDKELPLLDPDTPLLDELVDRAAARLAVRAPSLRVPTWFVRMLPERITKTSREALGFLDDARYPAEETEAVLRALGLERPDIRAAFDRWVDYLVRVHGVQPELRGALGVEGVG